MPGRKQPNGIVRHGVLIVSACVALTGPALAQSPGSAPARPEAPETDPENDGDQPTQLEEIVVIGDRPLIAAVEEYIAEVSSPVRSRGLARWTDPVCVGVINLQHELAQQLADRVSDLAREIALGAQEPGCRPDVLIVGADDGAAMAEAMVDSNPGLFRPGSLRMVQPRSALRIFTTSTAPVRWWTVSAPVDSLTGGTDRLGSGLFELAVCRPQ